MTELLIKLFVKSNKDVSDNKVRSMYAILASTTGIILNILLSIGKIIIGFVSNSISIISDGLNNFTDAGSSIVTMVGFKIPLGTWKNGVYISIYCRYFNSFSRI